MIAIALACEPRVLIADEPTTALDVTIQAQILTVLDELKEAIGMATLLVSTTWAWWRGAPTTVGSTSCTRDGSSRRRRPGRLFAEMRHPYTQALSALDPRLDPTMRARRS